MGPEDETGTAPDLEDRRSDGEKVTGKPCAEAVREAITRLVRVLSMTRNSLAPANRYNARLEEVTAEWVVTSDLIGATVGPGAAGWIDPAHLVEVGRRDGERYRHVVADNAAWVRA